MDLLKESEVISSGVIKNYLLNNDSIDYNAIRIEIREKLGKYFYHETESKPIIIVIIQEV
jgi:mRNA degradation ribonuclease J1/J2